MTTLASQTGPQPALFLLLWSLLALSGGGLLATRKWSTRFHGFIVARRERRPGFQGRAASTGPGLGRFIGRALAVIGAITLPLSVIMIVR
ncbi:hypothetical protein ACF063_05940 [Streptomyces chartreusis]|uniref:hypothetical protein n=1 Tax=Streptomyces chartreusis TaxID=1969 RepID=UPI0036F70DAA